MKLPVPMPAFSFGGSMFFAERTRIVELAAQSRVQSMYLLKEYAEAGGLMAYGPSIRESFRRAAAEGEEDTPTAQGIEKGLDARRRPLFERRRMSS